MAEFDGLVEKGNIDLANRPVVNNDDGTISTVRSMSIGEDGVEILIPTVSDDGRVLSDDEAVALYHSSGRHLGKFDTAVSATAYAERLHEEQDQSYGVQNPFDVLDDAANAGLQAGPRPSLAERFTANFQAGNYQNTLMGVANSEANMGERRRFDRYYEALPEWDGFAEGTFALAGQLAGTILTPESLIGGVGGATAAAKIGWAGIRGRVLAGAIDAGAVNAVTDAGIQGYEIARDLRDKFSPAQLAASTGLGIVAGGAIGAIAGRNTGRAPETDSANPFDALDEAPVAAERVPETAIPASEPAGAASKAPEVSRAIEPGQPAVVHDGAVGDLPAGELDGLSVTVAPDQSGVPNTMVAVDLPDGRRAVIGEDLLLPADGGAGEVLPTGPALAAKADEDIVSEAIGDRLAAEAGIPPRRVAARQERQIVEALAPLPDARPKRPQTLVEFLAANGGIHDFGGELGSLDVTKMFVPGRGRLVRASGRPLDDARLAAAQAGYFDHLYGTADEAAARSTVADFLDLIDRDARNRDVFSAADGERLAGYEKLVDAKAAREEIRGHFRRLNDEVLAQFDELGEKFDDHIVVRADEHMRDGDADPLSALDRALLEDYRNSPEIGIVLEEPDGREFEIPFFNEDSGVLQSQRGADGGSGSIGDGRAQGGAGAARPEFPGDGQSGRGESGRNRPDTLKSAPAGTPRPDMSSPSRPVGGIASRVVAPSPAIVRLSDVTQRLSDLLDVAAVRQGRLTGGSRVLGQFNTRTGVMRVRQINDFDTFAHEAGHHFEVRFPGVAQLIRKYRAILEPLAYEGAAKDVLDREGFAEFFRLWMTNRAAARNASPDFSRAFDDFLETLDPSVNAGLDDVARAYADYLAQPSGQAVDSGVVSSKMVGAVEQLADDIRKDGLVDTIIARGERIYTALVDDLNPLAVAKSHLADVYRQNTGKVLDIAVKDDFYKLARMSRGSQGLGQADILYGIHGYGDLDPSTPSLQDAVIEAMGGVNAFSHWDDERAQAFGSYLWSRRALGEFERFERGEIPNTPDGRTKGDHLVNIAEKEAAFPEFANAAPKVHAWALGLWKKKFDAGLISAEEYAGGLKIRDYVPGLRDFSGDADRAVKKPGTRDQSAKSGFMRRFRGSRRDVINPIESLMADAYETANAIARNDIVRALDRMALSAGPGGGAIAERVPAHELRAIMMNPVEALDAAAKAAGISPDDFAGFRDAIEAGAGDSPAMIFRPAVTGERGEPIIFFRDGGRLHALRLADGDLGQELYGALTAMGQKERNFFFRLLFGVSTFVRGMITTSPDFLLINGLRDAVASVIMYGKPLRTAGDIVMGMGQQVFNADVARRYALGGGISGGESSTAFADMFVRRDMAALKKKGWTMHRLSSLRGALEFTELSETGTRIALYKRFYEEQVKRGLSKYEAHLEASYRARDYMDFSRRGSTMAGLARLVPFFNAAIQGLDKSARHTLVPIAKQITGEALNAADREAAALAWKTWARIGVGIVATIGLEALLRDNEDYEELSDTTKAAHWNIPVGGNWLTIPKPHEFAGLFNLGQAAYESYAKQDVLAWERWGSSLMQMVAPPSMIEGNPLLQNYFELMSNRDTFTGRDIVPEHMRALEPWLQYTYATSMFARQIGEATNTSPAVIDHLITGFGASWGRNLLALYDHYSDVKPEQGWDEAFVTRRFIKDASRGSVSSGVFWDLMSGSTGRMKGVKKTYDALVGLDENASDDGPAAPMTSQAADFVAGLNEREYVYLNSNLVMGKKNEAANLKRRHPLRRAEDLTMALSQVRRDLAMDRLKDKAGNPFPKQMRGAALDILEDLAMNETRNALILIGEPGWENKREVPTDGYLRELKALSPELARVVYGAYFEKKVAPWKAVKAEWPAIHDMLKGPIGEVDIRQAVKSLKDFGGDFRDAGVSVE